MEGKGKCAHGAAVEWFGDEVTFLEPCPADCVMVLRAEGYLVRESVAHVA